MRSVSVFMNRHFCSFCAAALLLSMAAGFAADYGLRCRDLRESVLRLHILASSDGEADQNVKLRVRDAILNESGGYFENCTGKSEAAEILSRHLGELEQTADRVLAENGFGYRSEAKIVTEYFDTRTYGGVTLPAGEYTALKIVLGSGEGHNWWCVMFPPLCLSAAGDGDEAIPAVFGGKNEDIVGGKKEFRVRFKIAELVEKAIGKLTSPGRK